MKLHISAPKIKNLKAQEKPYEVVDDDLKGFLARVQPSGVITYYYSYRSKDGARKRYRIGKHPSIWNGLTPYFCINFICSDWTRFGSFGYFCFSLSISGFSVCITLPKRCILICDFFVIGCKILRTIRTRRIIAKPQSKTTYWSSVVRTTPGKSASHWNVQIAHIDDIW